jgi:hypothetical protein
MRQPHQPLREAAHGQRQQCPIGRAYIHQSHHTDRMQFFRRYRPDAPQGLYRQLLQERLDALGRDHRQAVGFLPAGSDFGQKLVRCDASRGGQGKLAVDAGLQVLGDFHRQGLVQKVLGNVQVSLVQRQELHQRSGRAKNAHHLLRYRLVQREIWTDDHQVRPLLHRTGHRHRGAHAELARFVIAGGDHAARLGRPAHCNGFAAQRRIFALLD